MLINVKSLRGFKLKAIDGEIGKVDEFYFDDHDWAIRYLVADTGSWLSSRQVLISPYAWVDVNCQEHYVSVNLSKKQIEDSPSIDKHKPVSRQYEESYHNYYGWPAYWSGPYIWAPYPADQGDRAERRARSHQEKHGEAHLRSTDSISGYIIQASDHEIGHVDDFIIDDENWVIRYLVVDTKNFWPGKKVLISPRWIKKISWSESNVYVNLLRETIKQAPEFKDESQITRDYEEELHQYYDRQGYWIDESSAKDDPC